MQAAPYDVTAKYTREGNTWTLVEYQNPWADERKKQEQEALAAEMVRREGARREEAALREAEARRKAALQDLRGVLGRYGASRLVSCSEVSTNPFAFEGEKVALVLDFEEMLERDKALFGRSCMLVASGIPARTFSTRQASVVLIGQVLGKTEVKIPLGTIPAPHLRFAGVHFCREAGCSEFWPR
jgi:hypothetical protein